LTSLQLGNCPDLNQLALFYNKLNASQMGQIVNALPTRSADAPGELYAIVDDNPEDDTVEENVITAAQVSQANAKYWDVYHWAWDGTGWGPYAGSPLLRGDVDDSGNVSIDDVTALIDYLLGSNPGVNLQNADADQSGNISIDDVTALIDYLLTGHWPSRVMRTGGGASAVGGPCLDDGENLVFEKPQRKRH
jgi:hypothetical protein